MRIGASLMLIAAGAILRWGMVLHTRIGSTRVNWDVVGDVLMVVGIVGLIVSMIWVATLNRRVRVDDGYPSEGRYPTSEGPYAP